MKTKLTHHSASDWDHGHPNWFLDATYFVSPPSSLATNCTLWKCHLCRIGGTQCLPQGRIVCSFFMTHPGKAIWPFRSQQPLGQANLDNCYYLSLRNNYNECRLFRRVAGLLTQVGNWDWQPAAFTWHKLQITWCNGLTPGGADALAVNLQRWNTDHWVDLGEVFDTINLWKDSPTNRLGVGGEYLWTRYDDTEIWKKT